MQELFKEVECLMIPIQVARQRCFAEPFIGFVLCD